MLKVYKPLLINYTAHLQSRNQLYSTLVLKESALQHTCTQGISSTAHLQSKNQLYSTLTIKESALQHTCTQGISSKAHLYSRNQLYSTLAIKLLGTPDKQFTSFPLISHHCTRSQANVWDTFISTIPRHKSAVSLPHTLPG